MVTFQVTFDCADPAALGDFWAQILGYRTQPPPKGFDSWEDWLRDQKIPEEQWNMMNAVVDPEKKGPRLLFIRVPEGKTAKNRVHLDVNATEGAEDRAARLDEEVARATKLGATELYRRQEFGTSWVTLTDPEGNEFCMQ